MSVAGITSINSNQLANVQQNLQKVQNEFKRLGQDLQSGNLTQAQADFVTFSQALASPPNFVGPSALDKQAGAAAGSSPANPPNIVGPTALSQSASASHHRVHLRQALSQLGQALQAGNLVGAQQAFSTMSQIWQQFTGSSVASSAGSAQAAVNVSA
jgi:hypothetical protein